MTITLPAPLPSIRSSQQERVLLGAQLLDCRLDLVGDWRSKVSLAFDTGRFNIESCAFCVIGHSFELPRLMVAFSPDAPFLIRRGYELAVVRLGLSGPDDEREVGFRTSDRMYDNDFPLLTAAWRELVTA